MILFQNSASYLMCGFIVHFNTYLFPHSSAEVSLKEKEPPKLSTLEKIPKTFFSTV